MINSTKHSFWHIMHHTLTRGILLIATILGFAMQAQAYNYYFSAVCPSGQTLYYKFNGTNTVKVTYPNKEDYYWDHFTQPTGALTIPSTVTYNGTSYTVTGIGDFAFFNCRDISSVTIPNTVTYISDQAFFMCSGASSITIPNSVTSIGYAAFASCVNLTSVVIPNSVTTIRNSTFMLCRNLTSVTIGNQVRVIEKEAFIGCNNLTTITIPSSVTSISDYAFDCSSLQSVTSEAWDAPDLGYDVFPKRSNRMPLHIPSGSRNSYVSAGWDEYFNILENARVNAVQAATYTIGTDDMRIVVRGAEGQRIRIYDNLGRLLSNTQSEEGVRVFVMPATGIYMVQVGNDPAHRVVIIH